jgi:hypothetical protein
MSTAEAGRPVRRETLIRIGSNIATTGVLFRNMLNVAASTSAASIANVGLCSQSRASRSATGWSAPVTSRLRVQISRAMMVISAVLPKPARKPAVVSVRPVGDS